MYNIVESEHNTKQKIKQYKYQYNIEKNNNYRKERNTCSSASTDSNRKIA